MSDVRETIARALCRLDGLNPGEPGASYDGHALVPAYLPKADAILSALSSAGLKVVPREPTDAMVSAALEAWDERCEQMGDALSAAWDAAK